MEKQQIIGLAQQGDLEAIATLLNQSLARYDTIAKVGQNTECLFVTLISEPVPNEETVIPIVLQEIERWKTDNIKKIKIYGRTERQIAPAWEDEISLEKLPQTIATQISQEPPTILNKPSLETNNPESDSTEVYNSETTNPETPNASKPSFSLRNLPMWGKGAIVALFASGSAGGLTLLSNQLNTTTPNPTTTTIPLVTPSASPTPTTTPTTKSTPTTPEATATPTPTTTPKATDSDASERKHTKTNTPTSTTRRRRSTTTNQQTQTQPTQSTKKRTTSTSSSTQTETKKTGTTNNTRSTQRTSVPKKTTPKRTTTPTVKPTSTPQSTGQPIYVPPPEKKTNVEIVPKSVNTPVQNNTNTGTIRRRNTDITPPSAPANRRNTDVTPPSAPASKKDVTPTGDNGGDSP